jgi:hypothetical protein
MNLTLRWGASRSLPAKTLQAHFGLPLSWFPCIANVETDPNKLPRQPTQLDARLATPSHLGAKTPIVTNAKHTISAKLKCSRFDVLFVVLKLSLSQTNSKILQESHNLVKRGWESLTRVPSFLRTISKQLNNAWNSNPPRRELKGINSWVQRN